MRRRDWAWVVATVLFFGAALVAQGAPDLEPGNLAAFAVAGAVLWAAAVIHR